MPTDIAGTRFTFEFDSYGRLHLLDDAKSLKFLEIIEKEQELQVLLGETRREGSEQYKPPAPNKPEGCTNSMCPMKFTLKLTHLVQEERIRFLEDLGG